MPCFLGLCSEASDSPITETHFQCPNLLSRFLHDKNSREFLYYRRKVAEIRKEAQKPQAATQKGKWSEEGREDCGMWAAKAYALMGNGSFPVGTPVHLQVPPGPN
jgi:hypothetical protein